MSNDPRAQAQNALKQAERAAKRGDLAGAERWNKAAERMVVTAERLAAIPQPEEENIEEIRANIRARLRRYAEAMHDNIEWEEKREEYLDGAAAAFNSDAPLPPELPPRPYTDEEIERLRNGEKL